MISAYLLGGANGGRIVDVDDGRGPITIDKTRPIATIAALNGREDTPCETYSLLFERGGVTVFAADAEDWTERKAANYLLARGLIPLRDATDDELTEMWNGVEETDEVSAPGVAVKDEMDRRGLFIGEQQT